MECCKFGICVNEKRTSGARVKRRDLYTGRNYIDAAPEIAEAGELVVDRRSADDDDVRAAAGRCVARVLSFVASRADHDNSYGVEGNMKVACWSSVLRYRKCSFAEIFTNSQNF